MKERDWISLADSLRHGRCILVLGPEVAADWSEADRSAARPPVTCADALKQRLAEELWPEEAGSHPAAAGSLASVAQHYQDRPDFGGSLRSVAAHFYASLCLEPSKEHAALASLPLPLIVSTCQDGLLADALTQAGKSPLVRRYHFRGDGGDNSDFPTPTLSAPVVYHLFGECQEAETLVLSENDLLDFLVAMVSDRPPIPSGLRRQLRRDAVSLLFVGFGIRYWYQRVLLKALIRSLPGIPSRLSAAVALEPLLETIPDSERKQTILFYQRGGTRLEVSDENILDFVAGLQQRVEKAGGLAGAASTVPPKANLFVSYARENEDLAAALFRALENEKLYPWLDTEGLRFGDDWEAQIEQKLREVDFVLVLVTPELVRKTVGYVNAEIKLARKRSNYYRGPFLIPLMTDRLGPDDRIPELRDLHEMSLREAHLAEDVAVLAKELRRDVQRRGL